MEEEVERGTCPEDDCDADLEANVKLWLTLYEGGWEVYGVGDDCLEYTCSNGHEIVVDRATDQGLSAFLENILPGKTWVGSDPRHATDEPLQNHEWLDQIYAVVHDDTSAEEKVARIDHMLGHTGRGLQP